MTAKIEISAGSCFWLSFAQFLRYDQKRDSVESAVISLITLTIQGFICFVEIDEKTWATSFSERAQQHLKMQEKPLRQFCSEFHVSISCRGLYFYGIFIRTFDSLLKTYFQPFNNTLLVLYVNKNLASRKWSRTLLTERWFMHFRTLLCKNCILSSLARTSSLTSSNNQQVPQWKCHPPKHHMLSHALQQEQTTSTKSRTKWLSSVQISDNKHTSNEVKWYRKISLPRTNTRYNECQNSHEIYKIKNKTVSTTPNNKHNDTGR